MVKTLRISFSLKNTYRVNSILYSLKQIPLVKKLLPDRLYQVRGLKIMANILSAVWEVLAIFLGKFLYLLLMVAWAVSLYSSGAPQELFLHILLFLTIAGSFTNTYLFNPSKDKYYALVLMRMNAKEYTLVNYIYAILKVTVGFLPFALLFGLRSGVMLWQCVLIPFFVAGLKITVASLSLWKYEKTGKAANENRISRFAWFFLFLLLGAAYGLPAAGIVLPVQLSGAGMILSAAAGIFSLWKILTFQNYHDMYRQLLADSMNQMDAAVKIVQEQNKGMISGDTGITSRKKGFEFLNELFIKRHQKILWKSAKKIACVCLALVMGVILAFYLKPQIRNRANSLLLTYLPYFVFIMYALNRGTGFTRALFMNCDRSLLTYSFYKQPGLILKLFRIRLWEIIKVNLLPAAVVGGGLAVLLYVSGGTDNPLNYAVIFISVICMSIFFSVHYLTVYYLLQPYNAGTEIKSGTYQAVMSGTYFVCFFMMKLKMPTLVFGCMTILFCLVYCGAACFLVYRFALKTFRLRT